MSAQSGVLRMQVLLGFIETRSVVIDAVIKTDGTLHYLSVICSSIAEPTNFSRIMKRTVPRAIIEEIDRKHAEDNISFRAVRDEVWNSIPFGGVIRTVNDSRRVLLALLLEYRALIADFNVMMPKQGMGEKLHTSSEFSIPFLIFEQDGSLCGIPDFQIEQISQGGNGSHILQLHHGYGQRLVMCTDLICIKEINIVSCQFKGKKSKGYYQVSTFVAGGKFDFTLIVPSFL